MGRMTTEIWKPIAGSNELYHVSNLGRVKSHRLLTPSINNSGYKVVNVKINGVTKLKYVHRLVAEAFIPNPNKFKLVLHGNDNDKLDNSVANLRWGTHSHNAQDKVNDGHDYNKMKTHCSEGHEYSGYNLIVSKRGDGTTFRVCRICSRKNTDAWTKKTRRDLENV